MAERMLKFIHTPRRTPVKRPAAPRASDLREVYEDFEPAEAAEQASRCSQCGVPFCQTHCPLHNNIPDWLRLTALGRLEEAYRLSAATSTMPEICGRICPQDRLCEGSCVLESSGHGTVTIGAVERRLTDQAWTEGWVEPVARGAPSGRRVAVIGAGPAGLSAAEGLLEAGHEVTVLDRHDRPGGLLVYGIPGFKLDKAVVERRTRRLADGGAAFRLGCEVGRDVGFEELRRGHDAVLIACGVYQARRMEVPGSGSRGVVRALDYLTASNRSGFGEALAPALDARGRRVVVVGGGDTAMDCVRTAVRQGAASVVCAYRRDRANMPGSFREVENAEEEGVRFEFLTAPRAVLGEADAAEGLLCARMRLGPPDPSGRRTPEDSGETLVLEADMIIEALGFDPEDVRALWGAEVALSRWGTIRADLRTLSTSAAGVFAAGDIVRGASLVVWAVRDGMDAARSINSYLAGLERPKAAA